MAQFFASTGLYPVKSLPCKQEDLSSHPQNLCKMPGRVHMDSATQGDRMGSEVVPWFEGVLGLALELLGESGGRILLSMQVAYGHIPKGSFSV